MMLINLASPAKTHPLLYCVAPFLHLIWFALIKMFAFGQLQSLMKNDLATSLHNLLTVPYLGRKMVDTSSFSGEQIDQLIYSQAIRQVDDHLFWSFIYFFKTNRFLWPIHLYILIVSFFLKCFSRFVISYYSRQRANFV